MAIAEVRTASYVARGLAAKFLTSGASRAAILLEIDSHPASAMAASSGISGRKFMIATCGPRALRAQVHSSRPRALCVEVRHHRFVSSNLKLRSQFRHRPVQLE